MDLKKTVLEKAPAAPGVYMMKNARGTVIYVGKAAHLKKRLASYFSATRVDKTRIMMRHVATIETIVTASEHEAFLLESRYIKRYQPKYNIDLKDDKSFPFIKITKDDYPRVFIGRKKRGERVIYFGPYTNAKLLRIALKSLRKMFPFCVCTRFAKRACLDYHIGLCLGPCQPQVSKAAYRKIIRNFKIFLRKGRSGLVKHLEARMRYCTERERFEEALQLREQIKSFGLLAQQSRSPFLRQLGLQRYPARIEAFDISNLYGKQAVGSMVTFVDGEPSKQGYRRFKIKTVAVINDYAMLREVLGRRYRRLRAEHGRVPDLIIIDGGKGHLGVAYDTVRACGIIAPMIAIAKQQELLYTVLQNEPIHLRRDDYLLQLIQRVRDEAHRFAVTYHRLLRSKAAFRSR